MKKSLLALAVLSAIAGTATAQSTVTIYGLVDANVGKDLGSDDKRVAQGAQSRLGFRGVEDLGGGLRATFNIQHRFDSGTGQGVGTPPSGTTPFWQAEANVGLAGDFGNVRIGRNYTEAFYHQVSVDPWGFDTVAGLKQLITGGIAADRSNNAISYWISQSGVTFGVHIAETADNGTSGSTSLSLASVAQPGTTAQKRPVSARLQYAAGPINAGVSYENPGDQDDDWTLVSGSYDFGVAKVGALYGSGTSAANFDRKSWALTATAPYGGGEARVAYGQLKTQIAVGGPDFTHRKQASAGYFYSLSKRTTIYGDYVKASSATVNLATTNSNGKKSDYGYDFGIKHVF